MKYPSDSLVNQLCEKGKYAKCFRDQYQFRDLVRYWRNYVQREDRFNRYAEMTSHGPTHMEGVATLVTELAAASSFLTDSEKFVLLAMAYLHDVGMYETSDYFYSRPMSLRDLHGPLSRERIRRERHLLLPSLADNDSAVELIALLCSYHQGKAVLSKEELSERPSSKRLRSPDYLHSSTQPSLVRFDELSEYPSLAQSLNGLTDQKLNCFSLDGIEDEGICPFRLAGLIKFIDGSDFQASRTGSIEALMRHADRNASHARRSKHIMDDCDSGTESHRRAKDEYDYFRGSFFHFARNLLIERTFIMRGDRDRQVEVVIKPADPDAVVAMCEKVSQLAVSSDVPPGSPLRSMEKAVFLLKAYQQDPVPTIEDELHDMPDERLADFLQEWSVRDTEHDRKTIHALVAKKYIERELGAISTLLDSATDGGGCCYCNVCPNISRCKIRDSHKRAMPSFRLTEDKWNVSVFDEKKHIVKLRHIPYLASAIHQQRLPGLRRTDAIRSVHDKVTQSKQVLLYGPAGRCVHDIGWSVACNLATPGAERVLWHEIEKDRDAQQVESMVRSLARFSANNGDFLLENLIRDEEITSAHSGHAIEMIRSGRFADAGGANVLCLDGFNRLATSSRPFFKELIAAFPCVNCFDASKCNKQTDERWECEHASSYVLAMSSKVPGTSWQKTVGNFKIVALEVPPMSEDEVDVEVRKIVKDEPIADEVCSVVRDYGSEPIGIEVLSRLASRGWSPDRLAGLLDAALADFYIQIINDSTLGGNRELEVLQLIGLLSGGITRADAEAVFLTGKEADEGPIQKLIDRGLIHVEEDMLVAHAACPDGHRRSRWMDRVVGHPWVSLVAFVGKGENPATVLQEHWPSLSGYLPELARLERLPGGVHHQWNPLEHSFRTLAQIDRLPNELRGLSQEDKALLSKCLDEDPFCSDQPNGRTLPLPWANMNRRGSLRIAALFHDIGKAVVLDGNDESSSYHGHEGEGEKAWCELAERFHIPSPLAERVAKIIAGHMHPLSLFNEFVEGKLTDTAIDRFIRKRSEVLCELLLLFLADSVASGKMDDRTDKLGEFVTLVLVHAARIRDSGEKAESDRPTSAQLKEAGLEPSRWFGVALKGAQSAAGIMPELTDDELVELASQIYKEEREVSKEEILERAEEIRAHR